MRRVLQILAVLCALAVVGTWLAKGASRGWTKTSVAVKVPDEVTGLEGISYQRRFVPGVDFLGGGLLGAGVLAAASLMFRKQNNPQSSAKPV